MIPECIMHSRKRAQAKAANAPTRRMRANQKERTKTHPIGTTNRNAQCIPASVTTRPS
jgi:hypothetical protein